MSVEDFIEKQERKGKIILLLLVFVNISFFVTILIMSMLNGIYNNILGLIIMIVLCVLIYYGRQTAKWVYIAANALNIFSLVYALTVGSVVSRAPWILNVITITMILISIITIVVLIFSSSVKEFMYKQSDSL